MHRKWVKFYEESDSDVKSFKFQVFEAENWISNLYFSISILIFQISKNFESSKSSEIAGFRSEGRGKLCEIAR